MAKQKSKIEAVPSWDEIDKLVSAHLKKSGRANAAAFNLCSVYPVARPILLAVKGILFLKPSWQAIITGLIAGLDIQCKFTSE